MPRGPFGYPNRIEQVIVNAAFTEGSHLTKSLFITIPATKSGRQTFLVCERKKHGRTERIGISNSEGLDAIFRAHYERLARVIGRVIHDQARAEELAVEVFLKWWRNPQAHGEHAEGWLYRTAVREALDELRRQTRRSRFERLFRFVRESPQTPEHLYTVNAEQHRVRTVLGALNRRHAGMLLLWSQGFSYQEIAVSLAVNSNYVGSLVSRAQEAFRKEYLKRYGNQS